MRQEFCNRLLQPLHPFLRKPNGFDHLLRNNLMSGIIEGLLLQPAQVAHGPSLLARVDAPVFEREGTDLLTMHP